MIFALEPLEQCWNEIYLAPDGLAYLHWMETQEHRHDQPYAPSFDRYNAYAKQGCFLQCTARDNGRLVGYSGFYLVPSMHTQVPISTEDTWYLLPEYRKGWNAVKFYKFIEACGAALGSKECTLTIPYAKGPSLLSLVKRLGYTPIAILCSKKIVRADSPSFKDSLYVQPESSPGP